MKSKCVYLYLSFQLNTPHCQLVLDTMNSFSTQLPNDLAIDIAAMHLMGGEL